MYKLQILLIVSIDLSVFVIQLSMEGFDLNALMT